MIEDTDIDPKDIYPLVVATRGPETPVVPLVMAATAGVAANYTRGGNASVYRYGAALTAGGGTANGGANGVALAHGGGLATAGDGGVAVAKNAGDAQTGRRGVAYSSSPRLSCGRVCGDVGSVLMFAWTVSPDVGESASVRVGESVNGVLISPNVWYTYDIPTATWRLAKQR